MKRNYIILILFSLIIFGTGCEVSFNTSDSTQEDNSEVALVDLSDREDLRAEALEKVNEQEAKNFSDKIAQALIDNDRQEIWDEWATFYKVDEATINAAIDLINKSYGQPEKVTYKNNEPGVKKYLGELKYYRRFFYLLETDKNELGKDYLAIEVVLHEGKLYSQSFQVLTYPSGPPEALR